MGGTTEPTAESGSCPEWMARVEKPWVTVTRGHSTRDFFGPAFAHRAWTQRCRHSSRKRNSGRLITAGHRVSLIAPPIVARAIPDAHAGLEHADTQSALRKCTTVPNGIAGRQTEFHVVLADEDHPCRARSRT